MLRVDILNWHFLQMELDSCPPPGVELWNLYFSSARTGKLLTRRWVFDNSDILDTLLECLIKASFIKTGQPVSCAMISELKLALMCMLALVEYPQLVTRTADRRTI